MIRAIAPLAAIALTAVVMPVSAQLGQRLLGARGQPAPGSEELSYGSDPLQRLDLWRATGAAKPAPLVVFVHGGGWTRGDKGNATGATKIAHWRAAGYAVASINYRLVPAHTVEEQAADVARATALLTGQSARLGVDPRRVVLMGHSAGAHLAALIGTDPTYLRTAGLAPDALAGVVLLDGAAYDVPQQIASGARMMLSTYEKTFGSAVPRQRMLSPTLQAAQPNAPSFLILHVERADSTAQSDALGAALRAAGTPAEVRGLAGKGLAGHMQINRELGDPAYPGTPIVDAYLARAFAR